MWECGCVSHYPLVLYCLSYKFVPFRVNRIQSARTKSTQIPRVGTQHTHTARLHQSFVSFISVCFFSTFLFRRRNYSMIHSIPFGSGRMPLLRFTSTYTMLHAARKTQRQTVYLSLAVCIECKVIVSVCVGCWAVCNL